MKSARYARDAINDRLSLYSTTSNISLNGIKPLRRKYADTLEDIEQTPSTNSPQSVLDCCPLKSDGKGNIVDEYGRKITLKGINVDGSMKYPKTPDLPSYLGNGDVENDIFFDGDNVSFVGRPFPVEEAESHFLRIKSWGYNSIRYLITWEALEHKGPKQYDDDYIQYTIQILDIIYKVGGLYVFIDPHQDCWSRFTGGSGAPLWTLYAAGLQPKRFTVTEAVVLHNQTKYNEQSEGFEPFPKMIWPSNYKRLASLTMFTLFYSGAIYFPDLVIDGINIQHYLQNHYLNALKYFWTKVTKELPHMLKNGSLFGFESLNEPNCGLVGHDHLGYLPANQQLRVGTTPTVYQTMKMGMGFPAEVDVYHIAVTGPQKSGTIIVDPKGQTAWLKPSEAVEIDKHYGWKRGSKWKLGECIYAQRKIWKWDNKLDLSTLKDLTEAERLELSSKSCELRLPNFFNQVSATFKLPNPYAKQVDIEYFTNYFFVDHYIKFKDTIRSVTPNIFILLQPPVLELPPNLKNDTRNIIDNKTIYCPHYYDGMSLMFKTWNTKYNVDTLGVMRGRYFNPVLGIVFGERAIRNCIKKQFVEIRNEGQEYLGQIPVLMSETGMPFDMEEKRAYEDGKYYSQTGALDALSYALEGANMSHTYWCYSSANCHKWGDRWNNEDFSFWSIEDRNTQFEDDNAINDNETPEVPEGSLSGLVSYGFGKKNALLNTVRAVKLKNEEFKDRRRRRSRQGSTVKPFNGTSNGYINATSMANSNSVNSTSSKLCQSSDDNSDTQSIQSSSLISCTTDNVRFKHNRKCYPSPDGVRAVSAVIRPYLVASRGTVKLTEFDLRSVRFALTLSFKDSKDEDLDREVPTVIFLPKWHYPYLNYGDIYLTSGHVKYNETLEYLEWYHYDENDVVNDDSASTSSTSTMVENDSSTIDYSTLTEETIIIKNNSGSIDDLKERERRGLLACAADDVGCPVT